LLSSFTIYSDFCVDSVENAILVNQKHYLSVSKFENQSPWGKYQWEKSEKNPWSKISYRQRFQS